MKAQHWGQLFGFLVLLFFAGGIVWLLYSGTPRINTVYGKRRGQNAKSLNGTAAFGRMFEENGARVRGAFRLSPGLSRSQVIVWTPDSFELPSGDEIEFLENDWLGLDDGIARTLIYVARDYEAAIDYWKIQANNGQGTSHIEGMRQLARVQAEHAYKRSLTGTEANCKWFSIDNQQHVFSAAPTTGPWARDIDSDRVELQVSGVLQPPDKDNNNIYLKSRVLLGSEETPLILELTDEYRWPDSRVIVLLNGSSTLNFPLVNHENRKIAGQLIDICESPRRVTFLESGPGGLIVSRSGKKSYSGFEALTVWPINVILLHLIAAGILYCVMVYPIFGRPRGLVEDSPSNFGKHVQAIQRLLERADNRELAIQRVNQYRQLEGDTVTKSHPQTETGNPFKVSQA